jgi:RNA polymerase sigma-70 factor (ECF subfamily)
VSTTPDDVGRAITDAQRGDGDALAVLWRTHQPLLLRYLRGRGASDAADIATQIWLDVAHSMRRFHGGADDFRRWLFTIARRRLIDERRRSAQRDVYPVDVVAVVDAADAAPAADVDYDTRDALARALALVGRLPVQMRDAVLLRFVADLSVADTAEVMGLRAGNVRVLTHRGLRQLERMLQDERGDVVTLPVSLPINPST